MHRPPASIIASYVLLIAFIVLSVLLWNTEFIIYAGILIPLVILLHKTYDRFSYHPVALWGFCVWMLLHLIGGLASWNGIRMYDYMLVPLIGEPYFILKYDQFVHFYCYVVIALLLSSVVAHVVKNKASRVTVAVITILAATGVGAVNEIIEFVPVVLLNSPEPGGYTNTAIDLVMNFLGSIGGTAWFTHLRP